MVRLSLVLAFFASVPTQAAVLHCFGQDSGRPELRLQVESGPAGALITGTSVIPAHEEMSAPIHCEGALRHTNSGAHRYKTYAFYDIRQNPSCPWDYLRVTKSARDNKFQLSLVNKTAGDIHDWSGYVYDSYVCPVR